MAKVIDFKPKKKKPQIDAEAMKLIRLADEIDSLILKFLEREDVDQWDIAGVLAHRLGSLIGHIEEKEAIWNVCEKVLKQQAAIKL